jgi:hypothetical protein
MLPSPRGPSKRYTNLVIWSRPRVNSLHCLCLSFHFLLSASSSFTSFLPTSSSCIFGYSLQYEVSIRKLKLSSSFEVVLQASQTAFVFYQLSSSTVSCTSGPLRLKLSSSIFSSSIVSCTSGLLRLQLFSTFFYKFNGCFFRSFLLFINI